MEHGIVMEIMKGLCSSSRVDLGYIKIFCIPKVTAVCSSRLVTVFLGTLWCSIKQIDAPYVFDWEHRIALHPMRWLRALTSAEGDVSSDFSSCSRNLGYILELQRGWTFETPLGSANSVFLSSYDRHLRS